MAEGLALIYGVDGALARFLAAVCSGYAVELLIARAIKQAEQDGVSESEMIALLNAAADAKRSGPLMAEKT